jgi:hypothetical protein
MGAQILKPSSREQVISRLAQDLIGPREPDERLRSKPSDVYLTGILWPRNTAVAPEEDERLSLAPGEGEEGDDSDAAAQAASVSMRRPSTAGVSFAARSNTPGPPQLRVSVRFACYIPERPEGSTTTTWRRVAVAPAPLVVALPTGDQDLPVDGGPAGLRLNVRAVPFEAGMLATITLVNGSTPQDPGRVSLEQVTLFQVELEIHPQADTQLIARPSRRLPVDEDDYSGALLYRNAFEFAAGHTCSATWDEPRPDRPDCTAAVRTDWLPEAVVPAVSPDGHECFRTLSVDGRDPLAADWLAAADDSALQRRLGQLCDAYEHWIALKAHEATGLPALFAPTAHRHLDVARGVLQRMRAGAQRLRVDPDAAAAFRLANLAMSTQRRWSTQGALRWRPFQLGFVLLSLESCIDNQHPDRAVMDLLWFPTGGGKTEAYLALIAMVAFFRRRTRENPDDGAGVAVIMRYTLRLLTTQQFMRAAAMVCACEAIRRGRIPAADATRLGTTAFSIGLWVGEGATPNSRRGAFESLSDRTKPSPRQLRDCPCCGKQLDYVQKRPDAAVEVYCQTPECVLSGTAPLPVWTVDEDVYQFRPTLLIGTVDKFAQIVRNPATSALFGVGSSAQPQLILQDELHLISGPLGTLAGLYETALDLILSADGTRPKIIGSTATIRRASEQVRALFDRDTCQFPPPGLDASDSGFSVVDPDAPGRKYVGVTTAGRSAKFTLQAVTASLLQSAAALSGEERDHYWTLLAYFNSLRELGGALVLMQDDVDDTLKLFAGLRGEVPRKPRSIEELTSRRSQQEIREMLTQLATPAGTDGALDVVLATNMVSVGVDIARLGLMVVNGQPKTIAEYIQATSRVGRGRVAGLVVPVLNAAKPRDRSHYETFRTWHATLYREVEATSVTPFASRARDRALHAVLVAVIRHLAPQMLQKPDLHPDAEDAAMDLIDSIAQRAARIDPLEIDVRDELQERLRRWLRRKPQQYWARPNQSLLQSAEDAAARRAAGRAIGQAWPTPNTLRGVEPASPFRLAERLKVQHDGKE